MDRLRHVPVLLLGRPFSLALESLRLFSRLRLILASISSPSYARLFLLADICYGLIVIIPEWFGVSLQIAPGDFFLLIFHLFLCDVLWSGKLLLIEVLLDASCCILLLTSLGWSAHGTLSLCQ